MKIDYTAKQAALLRQIRDDIQARADFYTDGAAFLADRFSPSRLSDTHAAEYEVRGCRERYELDVEASIAPVAFPPPPSKFTPARCAFAAFTWLLRRAGGSYNEGRAKAVLLMAVNLYDEGAHRLSPVLNVFGGWGVGDAGELESIGLGIVAVELTDKATLKRWMKVMTEAWKGLPKTPSIAQVPQVNADVPNTALPTPNAGDDDKPDPVTKLSPSRLKARAAYDWAIENIAGADEMTSHELHTAIMNHPVGLTECIPESAESFGRYLRETGVKKYDGAGKRNPHKSICRSKDI